MRSATLSRPWNQLWQPLYSFKIAGDRIVEVFALLEQTNWGQGRVESEEQDHWELNTSSGVSLVSAFSSAMDPFYKFFKIARQCGAFRVNMRKASVRSSSQQVFTCLLESVLTFQIGAGVSVAVEAVVSFVLARRLRKAGQGTPGCAALTTFLSCPIPRGPSFVGPSSFLQNRVGGRSHLIRGASQRVRTVCQFCAENLSYDETFVGAVGGRRPAASGQRLSPGWDRVNRTHAPKTLQIKSNQITLINQIKSNQINPS